MEATSHTTSYRRYKDVQGSPTNRLPHEHIPHPPSRFIPSQKNTASTIKKTEAIINETITRASTRSTRPVDITPKHSTIASRVSVILPTIPESSPTKTIRAIAIDSSISDKEYILMEGRGDGIFHATLFPYERHYETMVVWDHRELRERGLRRELIVFDPAVAESSFNLLKEYVTYMIMTHKVKATYSDTPLPDLIECYVFNYVGLTTKHPRLVTKAHLEVMHVALSRIFI
ncbi:MAG: hypothetical protein HY860_05010 [Chlamydiales bacterium]|nr:hypothetical protein [Chlamydiales bacterium]